MHSVNCTLTASSAGGHVKCVFVDSNPASTYIAVVHKRPYHLNSDGLMTIKTFLLNGSHHSSISVRGINPDEYQVGVLELPRLESKGI